MAKLDKTVIKGAFAAIRAAGGRRGGGRSFDVERAKSALKAGRKRVGERDVSLSSTESVMTAAKLLRAGATVPGEVVARFPFLASCGEALTAVALQVGCDAATLLGVFGATTPDLPEPEVLAKPAKPAKR